MNISKELKDNNLVVGLEGRLDTTTAPELEEALKDELEKVDSIIIDFSKLEYISSAGLRVLLSTHKSMAKKGGLKIVNVCPEIMEVFEITGFKDILEIE